MVFYCFYYLATLDNWHFIDNADLIIHEAGHFIFYIFGNFISIAGGSLMQLLIPALFAWYFFQMEQENSLSVMMYWLAINFFSVGHYAADAVNMNLPLLGGDNSIHDWNYLLSTLGLLGQTKIVTELIYFAGMLCITAGCYFSCKAFMRKDT